MDFDPVNYIRRLLLYVWYIVAVLPVRFIMSVSGSESSSDCGDIMSGRPVAAGNRFTALKALNPPKDAGVKLQRKRGSPGSRAQRYDYFLVLDFEATCECNQQYPNEIIEFPVVLIDTAKQSIVDEFHSYVRPQLHPKLTAFCTELTGITQDQVDDAPILSDVVQMFNAWLATAIPSDKTFIFVCDGPMDMRHFMHKMSVMRDRVYFPKCFYKWINIRKCYAHFLRCRPCGITKMARRLRLPLIGSLHSGIDDARNIARIALVLINMGCTLSGISRIEFVDDDAMRTIYHSKPKPDNLGSLSDCEDGGGKKSSGLKRVGVVFGACDDEMSGSDDDNVGGFPIEEDDEDEEEDVTPSAGRKGASANKKSTNKKK